MCLLQGKSGELRKSCQPSLNNDTWDSSILNLVEEGWCPSYLVPSTSINGLCLPQIALATPEQAANMSIIMERIQVSSVEMLEPKKVLEGSKYALEKLAIRGFWEKSLQDFVSSKPLLFLSVFLSISIFLVCLILSLRVYTVAILILGTSTVLFSLSVFSFYSAHFDKDFPTKTVNKTNRLFWLFLGISALMLLVLLHVSVSFNFCAKHLCPTKYIGDWSELLGESTRTIEQAVRRIWLVKPILLVPTISLLLKTSLFFLVISSSCLLVSPSAKKEFMVVGACLEELCINNNTNKFFGEGDLCLPDHFK